MPIIQENPTYFSDKPAMASSMLSNKSTVEFQHISKQCGNNNSSFGVRRKQSISSYDVDTEDGASEMETLFMSSCESNNSYSCGSEPKIIQNGAKRSTNNNSGYIHGSLKRNCKVPGALSILPAASSLPTADQKSSSGISSLTRLGQLFKKSKSKLSVGSDQGSHASTVESSGIGSPPATCTPDSSLSIYTNSLDGDSHSHSSTSTSNSIGNNQHNNNNNQIDSPKHDHQANVGESMEDKFCSTYTFDDCGIFAANMYYNVGESSVFTIYHQNGTNGGNKATNSLKSRRTSASANGNRRDDPEDCIQSYYNNATFSTFPNPKRCSVASAASTTTSSVVPVPISQLNENDMNSTKTGTASAKTLLHNSEIEHDRDGYLRPNEPRAGGAPAPASNLRNIKNLYINDSVIWRANRNNGQVQQVQVDVHTPTSATPLTCSLNRANSFSDGNNSAGFNSSAGGASRNGNGSRFYHFDSAGSTASAATTLVAGEEQRKCAEGSNNFSGGLPEDEKSDGFNKSNRSNHRNNGPLPIYMNRAYFGSDSFISPASASSSSIGGTHRRAIPISGGECEPYCSLCSSSIMGSPRQRSRMDVAIVKCRECFFSREAEAHIRTFFDKLMTEDKQKMDITLKSYDLKDLEHPSDNVVVHCAKVQIVIISHHFLQRLKDEASRRPRLSPINRVFRSKSVIAVLLAVSANEVQDGYESVLPRFSEWFSVDLRSTNKYDPEFSKRFMDQVLRIYNLELSNSSNFSVFPKKVTREQPKICISFKKPIERNDEIRIELRTQRQVSILSDVKLENPHTTLVRIPESLTPEREAIVDVSVFINKMKIGGSKIKSELNLKRIDEDDQIDRMAKLLPPFLDLLDKHISDTLLKHYRQCTDYNADPELELMNGIIICKADILPTIMHFSAYYGLRKTAFTVLHEAEGLSHCNIRNELDERPTDVAFARGHTKLGHMIVDYQEISNCYNNKAYRYIKELMEKDTDTVGEGGESPSENEEVEQEVKQENNGALFFMNPALAQFNLSDENNEQMSLKNEYFELPEEDTAQSTSSSTEFVSPAPSNVSEEAPSETNSCAKNDDIETKRKPTPSTRRRMNNVKRRTYVNVDGNPGDNPETVQPREKIKGENSGKVFNSPEYAMKRRSILQYYDVPRTRDQDYKMPPPDLRPVRKESQTSSDLEIPADIGPVFKKKNDGPHVTASGYLIMNVGGMEAELEEFQAEKRKASRDGEELGANKISSAAIGSTSGEKNTEPAKVFAQQDPVPISNGTMSHCASSEASSTSSLKGNRNFPRKNSNINNQVVLDAADEQLIGLMNEFKNKTYDIRTVELLFENWKQRPDVKRSIEDKLKMLEKLREEFHETTKSKKPSTLSKLKTILTKRKKSTAQLPEAVHSIDKDFPDSHSTNNFNVSGIASPTGLTFTGPSLPTQPFSNVSPSPPFTHVPNRFDPLSRVSESSHRTSIDSRFSDSSADSDKPAFNTSENKHSLEYRNPMNKGFIPSYVYPNPSPPHLPTSVNVEQSQNLSYSYQVPPPPRPVKPIKKPALTIPQDPSLMSPKKPPAIPEEDQSPGSVSPTVLIQKPALPLPQFETSSASSSVSMHNPPAIPAKPQTKYKETEPSSPAPMPPPRSANSPSPFSYVDYRKKNRDGIKDNDQSGINNGGIRAPYENMDSEESRAERQEEQ